MFDMFTIGMGMASKIYCAICIFEYNYYLLSIQFSLDMVINFQNIYSVIDTVLTINYLNFESCHEKTGFLYMQ